MLQQITQGDSLVSEVCTHTLRLMAHSLSSFLPLHGAMAHSPLPYPLFCHSMDAHSGHCHGPAGPPHCALSAAVALSPSLSLSFGGTKGEPALRRLSLTSVSAGPQIPKDWSVSGENSQCWPFTDVQAESNSDLHLLPFSPNPYTPHKAVLRTPIQLQNLHTALHFVFQYFPHYFREHKPHEQLGAKTMKSPLHRDWYFPSQ